MSIEAARRNERWKALATVCDNIGTAFIIAAGAVLYDKREVNLDVLLGILGTVVSLGVAWYLRNKIGPEN